MQSEQFNQLQPIRMNPHYEKEIKIDEISSDSILLSNNQTNTKNERLVIQIESMLMLEFCTVILRSKDMLNNFLTTYSELIDGQMVKPPSEMDYQTIQCSNEYVMCLVDKLLDYFEGTSSFFMKQIQIPFECKPIDILRFMRTNDEEQSLDTNSK